MSCTVSYVQTETGSATETETTRPAGSCRPADVHGEHGAGAQRGQLQLCTELM